MFSYIKMNAVGIERALTGFPMFYGNCTLPVLSNILARNNILVRHYAARKGTREKAKKKKVKIEIKKVGFIPHILRDKATSKGPLKSKRFRDDFKAFPEDDVWISKFFRWKVYSFEEAVKSHRETHHPQIYNQPNAFLHAFIELDMQTSKKTKFVDSFTRIAKVEHTFPHGEDRTLLAFCKTPEIREEAEAAGATLVGDADLVKKVERGEIVLPDFQFVLAHPNILPELTGLRGILKKKFPTPKQGTLGIGMTEMVKRFLTGVQYAALKDEVENDYGWINVAFGTLDMEVQHLENNLKALIEDILLMRPKRPGPFITRIMLRAPPSKESFKLNLDELLPEEELKDQSDSDSEDEKVVSKNV